MKTNNVPGSSVDQTQPSKAQGDGQVRINRFFSLSSRRGWQTKVIGSLGVMLVLAFALLPAREVQSGDQRAQDLQGGKLAGTWNVTLRFPECDAVCPCPGGVPNIPIPNMNTYEKDGTLLVAAGSLLAGPGHGWWERIGRDHYLARFQFFIFNSSGQRVATEIVTKDIHLTGPDTFEATSTFELFDTAGNLTAQGCVINETATRFL